MSRPAAQPAARRPTRSADARCSCSRSAARDEVGRRRTLDVGASGGLNLLLDRTSTASSRAATSAARRRSCSRPDPGRPAGPDRAARGRRPLRHRRRPDRRDRRRRGPVARGLRVARPGRPVPPARRGDRDRPAGPPELLAGDAVPSLAPAIERMARGGHPVVTNSWVLNYLTPSSGSAYVAELDRIGGDTDLSWVYVESPGLARSCPAARDPTARRDTGDVATWRAARDAADHSRRATRTASGSTGADAASVRTRARRRLVRARRTGSGHRAVVAPLGVARTASSRAWASSPTRIRHRFSRTPSRMTVGGLGGRHRRVLAEHHRGTSTIPAASSSTSASAVADTSSPRSRSRCARASPPRRARGAR